METAYDHLKRDDLTTIKLVDGTTFFAIVNDRDSSVINVSKCEFGGKYGNTLIIHKEPVIIKKEDIIFFTVGSPHRIKRKRKVNE